MSIYRSVANISTFLLLILVSVCVNAQKFTNYEELDTKSEFNCRLSIIDESRFNTGDWYKIIKVTDIKCSNMRVELDGVPQEFGPYKLSQKGPVGDWFLKIKKYGKIKVEITELETGDAKFSFFATLAQRKALKKDLQQ